MQQYVREVLQIYQQQEVEAIAGTMELEAMQMLQSALVLQLLIQ